ncbi:MAG: hypothetical protein DRH56_08880 [Deltaproteobacteria bacterium]|nr:MAG: hypothetical protein DRH56_08880 [Deltaproteobacteria bacterium]
MKSKIDGSWRSAAIILMAVICLATWLEPPARGAEKHKNLPPRRIVVSPEYTGVVVFEGEDVNIDLKVADRGRRDEDIRLSVTSVPKGWKAWIKTYSFRVTGVHLASDSSKSLTFHAEADPDLKPGKYVFGISARTADHALTSTAHLTIEVRSKVAEKTARKINIQTSYPVLRGPTDGKFEFSIEVENKSGKDGIFNLSAKGPENWEINFKPAYEEKFISSLRLKSDQSQTVAVEVKPYPFEKPGRYAIQVKIGSPAAKGTATLSVILTGTYKLDAGTPNGLLSLSAVRGKAANLSFYIRNSGSAALDNIQFMSLKPENWKVKFNPEKIDLLPPGQLKQVEVLITPTEDALVGDYSVGITAEAGKVNKSLELRVTVNASAAWGWIGIGIIILVIVGLVTLFLRLGRR